MSTPEPFIAFDSSVDLDEWQAEMQRVASAAPTTASHEAADLDGPSESRSGAELRSASVLWDEMSPSERDRYIERYGSPPASMKASWMRPPVRHSGQGNFG